MNRIGIAVLVAVFLVGCGTSGPELGQVSGVITLDGKPAARLTIRFLPRKEGSSPSYGSTDAEGHYELQYTAELSGAMTGPHDVEIEALEREFDQDGHPVGPEPLSIPEKYRTAGTLTAEVKSGSQTIDFALESPAR